MDEGPEPGELPAAAGQALGRLLSHENQISDLIAFLAALDSEPLLEAFGLSGTHCHIEREELLGKGAGRADLIVRDESGPVALLEIKVGAAQPGDQFARYVLRLGVEVGINDQVSAAAAMASAHDLPAGG